MKKLRLLSIMLACLMTLAFVSCDNNTTGGSAAGPEAALNGTWEYIGPENLVLIFNNGNFDLREAHLPGGFRGTFTISGNFLLMQIREVHGSIVFVGDRPLPSRWYTRDELIPIMENEMRRAGEPAWMIAEVVRELTNLFAPSVESFTLSGNVLSVTFQGEAATFTRRN